MEDNREDTKASVPEGTGEAEENVVSVWHGSGNTAWFRRRWFEGYPQYETLEPDGRRVMHKAVFILPLIRHIKGLRIDEHFMKAIQPFEAQFQHRQAK